MTPPNGPRFTGDDLEELKRKMLIKVAHGFLIDFDLLKALLARLASAERFIEASRCQSRCTCDNECEIHLPLERTWRSISGKTSERSENEGRKV